MEAKRAKLFWTGRSQALRLPKEFRFDGDEVLIRREGNTVVLEVLDAWPEDYVESFADSTCELERPPQGELEERETFE